MKKYWDIFLDENKDFIADWSIRQTLETFYKFLQARGVIIK